MHPPFLFLDNDRTIELSRTVVQPVGDAADVPTIRDRLGQHKLALERAGVTDLSTLGLMRLSGPVIPQVGVAVPEQDQYEAQMVPFQHAYKFDSDKKTNSHGRNGTSVESPPVGSQWPRGANVG